MTKETGDTYDLNLCIRPHKFGNLPHGQILRHHHFQSLSLPPGNDDRFLTSSFLGPLLRQLRAVHSFKAVGGKCARGGTVEEDIVGMLVGEDVVRVAEVEGRVVYIYVAAFGFPRWWVDYPTKVSRRGDKSMKSRKNRW